MLSLLLVLFSTIPNELVIEDSFEKVELNHFYDDQGRHVFDQVIWYDWDYLLNRHKVEYWKLVKNSDVIPILNRQTNLYESIFSDNDVLRKVKAKYFLETWSQYDPELIDRETYDKKYRRELTISNKKIKPQNSVVPGIIRAFQEIP